MAAMLNGLTVLVTRPALLAAGLCQLIEESGGAAITFPVIKIVPVAAAQWQPYQFNAGDAVVFISRNAAANFAANAALLPSENVITIAVGSGTAAAMQAADLRVDLQPEMQNSEGLLSLFSKQRIKPKTVWIVRGVGGREYLAENLRAQGIQVAYIEVYERQLPQVTTVQQAQAATANVAVVTSTAGLDNLCTLLPAALPQLKRQPLLVVSDRIARHAVQYGFTQISIAAGADNAAVTNTLAALKK